MPSQRWEKQVALSQEAGKTADCRGKAAGVRHGDEPGPDKPTSPHRKIRRMNQEERNMVQSRSSCGFSVQIGSVIHRTSYERLEKESESLNHRINRFSGLWTNTATRPPSGFTAAAVYTNHALLKRKRSEFSVLFHK